MYTHMCIYIYIYIYNVWFLDHHQEGQLDAERLGGVGGAGDVGGAHLIYIYIYL